MNHATQQLEYRFFYIPNLLYPYRTLLNASIEILVCGRTMSHCSVTYSVVNLNTRQ